MDEYNERWKKRCDTCSCNPCDGRDRILRVNAHIRVVMTINKEIKKLNKI